MLLNSSADFSYLSLCAANVCWYCKGGSNYFWGYYTNELDDARKKLNERYQSECRMPYNQPAQKQKNGDYRER